MPIYNSKQAGMVFVSQRIVSFYHDTIPKDASNFFFYQSDGDVEPKYTLDVSSFAGKYRCLQHKNFAAYAYSQTVCPFALYIDESDSCNVLFETNFIQCQQSQGVVMCTFWSTLTTGTTCRQAGQTTDYYYHYGKIVNQGQTKYYYKYDPAVVYKVNVENMDTFNLQDSYKNILCAIKVQLQPMWVSTDKSSKIQQDVAIIKNRPIVLQQMQSNAPAFDFSLSGAGSGAIKYHNHIPHIDGTGFAFAVFHPGTTMPQLSWSSV